ncbi:MAG: hypothetical protein VX693_00355 [Pseudomonadota bacterium]|nr:hypothetical protein [Pseudomonadota bacterium]
MDAYRPAAGFIVNPTGRREGTIPTFAEIMTKPNRVADCSRVGGDFHNLG